MAKARNRLEFLSVGQDNHTYRYYYEWMGRIRTNPGKFIFSVPCLRVRAGGFVVSWHLSLSLLFIPGILFIPGK